MTFGSQTSLTTATSILHIPQLESAIKRSCKQVLQISGEASTCDLVLVASQGAEEYARLLLVRSGPHFNLAVVAAGDHQAPRLLELNIAYQFVVRQDSVHNSLFAQVPNLHSVIVAACRHLIPVGQEVYRDDLLDVSWELEDIFTAP